MIDPAPFMHGLLLFMSMTTIDREMWRLRIFCQGQVRLGEAVTDRALFAFEDVFGDGAFQPVQKLYPAYAEAFELSK